MVVEDDEIAKTEEVSSCHCPVPPPHCLSAPNQAFCPDLLRLTRSSSVRGMSLGTAIAELQRRFDRLARTKGGNPGTYGTKGRGKGQQPKRKTNPAHVAGAIAVLKALSTSRRWPRPSPPVAEQGGWGLRDGPIYLSLQKTSASASRRRKTSGLTMIALSISSSQISSRCPPRVPSNFFARNI